MILWKMTALKIKCTDDRYCIMLNERISVTPLPTSVLTQKNAFTQENTSRNCNNQRGDVSTHCFATERHDLHRTVYTVRCRDTGQHLSNHE
jgi:hypothetical protein